MPEPNNIINIGPSPLPGIVGELAHLNPTRTEPGIRGTTPPLIPPRQPYGSATLNPTENDILLRKTSFIPDPYTVNITSTNVTAEDAKDKLKRAAGRAASAMFSIPSALSLPLLNQIGSGNNAVYRQYTSLPVVSLNKLPVDIQDFRSRLSPKAGSEDQVSFDFENANSYLQIRLDGASAVLRGSGRAAAYAAAAASPAGAYSLFGRNTMGTFGYGMGDPGDPHALRNDFTARSQVATVWKKKPRFLAKKDPKANIGRWVPTLNPLEMGTPFRGDKVNVIDFSKRKLSEAYLWKPSRLNSESWLGRNLNKANKTNDFIKFIMTGPKLGASEFKNSLQTDDIFAFRCTNLTVSDNFNAAYTAINMIGRADPNYHYGGFTRDVSIGFTVHATDRDELKPIWRKLNFLAGYTAPEYNPTQLGLTAPFMRITVGDLFVQQPVLISSLGYELAGGDTSWEINIEGDPTNMQVPHSVNVSMTLYMITDTLPQKGGRFYSLAKSFTAAAGPERPATGISTEKGGTPIQGNDNWLSDALDTAPKPIKVKKKNKKQIEPKDDPNANNTSQVISADRVPFNNPPAVAQNRLPTRAPAIVPGGLPS